MRSQVPAGDDSMEISGYGNIFFSQEAEESARARRSKSTEQEGSALGLLGGSDTVSISEEARKLAEKMLLEKQEEEQRREQEQEVQRQVNASLTGNGPAAGNAKQESAAGAVEGTEEANGASGGGPSGGSSSDDQIASIKKKIQELQAKLQTTASSSLPENVKQSQVGVLQSQINELQQQLNAMVQQAA